MQETVIAPLASWENFYVIIGSAAAALTGLMFVVITLMAGIRIQKTSNSAIAAFSTPTVVHFCVALLIAAILSAPWPQLWYAGILLGSTGIGGSIYVIVVIQRTRRQTAYQPVLEDWLWHTIFPFASYIALIVSALLLLSNPVLALFIIGAATILLIFIGIHNAWDNVAYIVTEFFQPDDES